METELENSVQVLTEVSNLARNLESTNTVTIYLHELILEEDQSFTLLGSSRICFKPRDGFSQSGLSQFLDEQEVSQSSLLGEAISRKINNSLANDNTLREPVYVTVNINFIEGRRRHVPPPLKSASLEVIQRLVKEQRVEPMDMEETNELECAICIEDLSDSHENIIRMPQCKHMFHQDCLVEWLSQQNSCPLCRSTVPTDDQETENLRFCQGLL